MNQTKEEELPEKLLGAVKVYHYQMKMCSAMFIEPSPSSDSVAAVRPEKFQFLEKWQKRNFEYKIVISVKNLEFILWIYDEEADFTVKIISRNLAST